MEGIVSQLSSWIREMGLDVAARIALACLILIPGSWIINRLIKLERKALEKSKLEKAAHSMVTSLSKVALNALLFLSGVSALGVDVTGVVAIASILTLAVSLAMQSVLTNVVGGFMILYTHPFHSGDFVTIAGYDGTVDEISMMYTRLITPDNHTISIPNSMVGGAEIINYTALGKRRVNITVGADYKAEPADVLQALREAAMSERVLVDPEPNVFVSEYADNDIKYTLQFWVLAQDYLATKNQVTYHISEVFCAKHIAFSYPHVNIHMVND